MVEDVGVPVWEPELPCVPVGGGIVEVSVTLDSSGVIVVEDATVAGGTPESLDTIGGGMIELVPSVAGGAGGLLVSLDGGADDSGGAVDELEAGGAEGLLPVDGVADDSAEEGGEVAGMVDCTPGVGGPGAETESDTGGA